MSDLRRFTALRRRLNALQQESYTVARVIENTDWRGHQPAELSSLQAQQMTLDDEMADIEYLLDYYEDGMHRQPLVVTPQTVATVALIILLLFIGMTMAAGAMAGIFYAN